MKCLLIVFTTLICLRFNSQVNTQFISYIVPIHLNVETDVKGEIIGMNNEMTMIEIENNSISRLDNNSRQLIVENIFKKLYSGEVIAYEYDEWFDTGREGYEMPEEYFKTEIPTQKIKDFLSQKHSIPRFTDAGDFIYDDYGNPLFYDTLLAYEPDDVTSLTFYEEWMINSKTNMLSKKVKGYTINVNYYNPDSGELMGIASLCYIPCLEKLNKKTTIKIKNFHSTTTVKNGVVCDDYYYQELIGDLWWQNNLFPNVRTPFIGKNDFAPFLSTDKQRKIYDVEKSYLQGNVDELADFPFSIELNGEEVIQACQERMSIPVFDYDGNYELDSYGNETYLDTAMNYYVSEIAHLGFIEEWSFDMQSLSFHKEVKGIMPVVDYHDQSTGEITRRKTLYCLRYK